MIGNSLGIYASQNVGGGAYNFEQALEFDGIDDFVELPSTFNSSNATISFWIKTNETSNCRVLGLITSPVYWIDFRTSTNQINLRRGLGGVSFTFPSITTGNWNHVLVSDSSGTCRVFLNGVESTSGAQGVGGSFEFDEIMRSGGAIAYQGILDDLTLYNNTVADPLAAAVAIYNGGAGADPLSVIPNAQQLYRFNNNTNNDGSLGGSATLNNFSPSPYVPH